MSGCRYQGKIWWLMVKFNTVKWDYYLKRDPAQTSAAARSAEILNAFVPRSIISLGPVAVCVGLFDKIKVINSHFLVMNNHLKPGLELGTRVELMLICLALKWLGVLCLEPITLRMTSPAEQKQFKIVQVKSLLLAALHCPKIRPGLGASG